MYSALLFIGHYTYSIIILVPDVHKLAINTLIISLFRDSTKARNNLFLPMKHFVSKRETICFKVRNRCETLSRRL